MADYEVVGPASMISLKQAVKKIEDTAGASIVIALVFFLICALVGSMVLTAATVNSRSMVTYKQSRQSEYTVSSAAQLIGAELQQDIALGWNWSAVNAANKPVMSITASNDGFAKQLWGVYRDDLWEYNSSLSTWRLTGLEAGNIKVSDVGNLDPVYATIEVDHDFNIKIYLSLDEALSDDLSPYNEIVELQSITSYNNLGQLIGVSWEKPVITKVEKGADVP